jgi:hypothetical protein
MDCPYCGEHMIEGFLLSERRCGWAEKPAFFTKWEVSLISLSIFTYGKKQAYCCRKCHKIIIDY